jgi:hypothetical protein
MYYKITITETGKEFNPKAEFETFNRDIETFKTKEDAIAFIKEKYQGHKKQKMYIDGTDGQTKQIGWIFGFVNSDISHNSRKWIQQDWVEITEVTETPIVF